MHFLFNRKKLIFARHIADHMSHLSLSLSWPHLQCSFKFSDYTSDEEPTTDSTCKPPEGSSSPPFGNVAEWVAAINELSYMRGSWDIVSIQDIKYIKKEEDVVTDTDSGLQIEMIKFY